MDEKKAKTLSKFLSLVLRHQPEAVGISLDEHGWTNIETLQSRAAGKGRRFNREELEFVVANNNKKRFSISEDGLRIRANQGHSIEVNLELKAIEPPEYLYHGTTPRFLDAIRRSGLLKMKRQHVHLSKDLETAINVGGRHGKPVILKVQAGKMYREGGEFYLSENGVWLSNHIPVVYLEFP